MRYPIWNALSTPITLSPYSPTHFHSFDSIFPYAAFQSYTSLSSLSLQITLSGSGSLLLSQHDKTGNIISQNELKYNAPTPTTLSLPLSSPHPATTALSFSCLPTTQTHIQKAAFATDIPKQRSIHLAVGICTYRRELFVVPNVLQLTEALKKYPGNHHIFIADNGRTLGSVFADYPNVTVTPLPNTGGSGGFSYVMQQATAQPEFTHLLLMDDDIRFSEETILRTLHFLSYLKPEYRQMTLGGAMQFLDTPWMQFEAGTKVDAMGGLHGMYSNLDLRETENCFRNAARTERSDYAAWWYCCMECEAVRAAGMPMPFFIKMDDVEYGLRMQKPVFFVPGIGVAHADFAKKYNPTLDYYITRNTLFLVQKHRPEVKLSDLKKQVRRTMLQRVLLQRYENAELIWQAWQDFRKGTAFLENVDAEALHKQLGERLPKWEALPAVLPEMAETGRVPAWLGWLLPSWKGVRMVEHFGGVTRQASGVKRLCHGNVGEGKCYWTKLRRWQIVRSICRRMK